MSAVVAGDLPRHAAVALDHQSMGHGRGGQDRDRYRPITIEAAAVVERTLGDQMAETYGYAAHKDSHTKRLRRIEGQVRGIAKMIDDDKYCIDILTQISAVSSALRSVALNLLDEHLDHCVSSAIAEGGDDAEVKLAEASAAIARLVRS